MAQKNAISATLDNTEKEVFLGQIQQLKEQLKHLMLFNLTPADKQGMIKMGDRTIAFVGKALEYASQNPELVPAYVSLDEAIRDYNLASQLNEIAMQLSVISTALDDTITVCGSEAYDAALQFYGSVKGASRSNLPGSQAIYDELSKQFPGRPAKVAKTAGL